MRYTNLAVSYLLIKYRVSSQSKKLEPLYHCTIIPVWIGLKRQAYRVTVQNLGDSSSRAASIYWPEVRPRQLSIRDEHVSFARSYRIWEGSSIYLFIYLNKCRRFFKDACELLVLDHWILVHVLKLTFEYGQNNLRIFLRVRGRSWLRIVDECSVTFSLFKSLKSC
jgi:hypothetical protein